MFRLSRSPENNPQVLWIASFGTNTELAIIFRLLSSYLLVIFGFIFSSHLAYADSVGPRLPFLCDERTGAIFVSINPERKPSSSANWKERSINWQALLNVGPNKNQLGDLLRSGSRVSTLRCGALTIRFASGFLNSNPQGELGALDFPLIEIVKGKRVLLDRTALEPCALTLSRYNYFGACPASWAQSIEVVPQPQGMQIKVLRVFFDAEFNEIERFDLYDEKSK